MIVVVGATGHLGSRIVHHLQLQGVAIKALVRINTSEEKLAMLKQTGADILPVDFKEQHALVSALKDSKCIVSAVSGLEDVIVTLQSQILNAAVSAGVPRFIPSDFCIDYTTLPEGRNRNLDLRRRFNHLLDHSPIQATSVLNGMFMDLLRRQAPVILQPVKRIMYYGNPDQPLDFTTLEDTAAYAARVAMDDASPRYLRIAGEVAGPRELARIASDVFQKHYRLLRPGGLKLFRALIAFTKIVAPQPNEVFPAWQGMQYLHDMLSGQTKLHHLDNDRYNDLKWTTIRQCLLKK